MLGVPSVTVDEITLLGLAFIGLAFKWKFFSQACACRCPLSGRRWPASETPGL